MGVASAVKLSGTVFPRNIITVHVHLWCFGYDNCQICTEDIFNGYIIIYRPVKFQKPCVVTFKRLRLRMILIILIIVIGLLVKYYIRLYYSLT